MADKMMEKQADRKDDKDLEREVEAQAKAAKPTKPAEASKEGEVDTRKSKRWA
jgi:hypothetical protein